MKLDRLEKRLLNWVSLFKNIEHFSVTQDPDLFIGVFQVRNLVEADPTSVVGLETRHIEELLVC